MGKSKRGPALIELIHKKDAPTLRRPEWMETGAPVADSETAPTHEATGSADGTPTQPLRDSDDDDRGSGTFSIRGDRVIIRLSSVSAGIVVFVLIAAIGSSYIAGQRDGNHEGLRDGFAQGVESIELGARGRIEAARRSTPNPDIFAGLPSNPLEPATSKDAAADAASAGAFTGGNTTQKSPWVAGHTYIVVQDFKSEDSADVEAAQQFLRDNGIDSAVLESKGTYKYRLVATKGFNRDDAVQRQWCDEYHERIREIGKSFVKAGGRYDLQGYPKKLTGPGW